MCDYNDYNVPFFVEKKNLLRLFIRHDIFFLLCFKRKTKKKLTMLMLLGWNYNKNNRIKINKLIIVEQLNNKNNQQIVSLENTKLLHNI